MSKVHVIGAGLAGCECAYQITKRGIPVTLHEMKPVKKTPAHTADGFAELVCSNSFRSDRISNAAGLLKEEMRLLDSIVMRAADATSVPAGGALAVNRDDFSAWMTRAMRENPNITVVEQEVCDFSSFDDTDIVIVTSGPLTSDALSESIMRLTGERYLHFFDAAAPIVDAASVDMEQAFTASRYDRGSDYINCPMDKETYLAFHEALLHAECAEIKEFEQNVFEGCMPVETMAARGVDTLRFGPLKPKGLQDPRTGREPYAVVQLRKEDAQGSMYNLVGFQTHLKFPEQRRVFGMIPALRDAEFLRYGVMHRNTFLNSPKLLDGFYRLKSETRIRFAGQITGVEGYLESAASGLWCGIATARERMEQEMPQPDACTAVGALALHVSACISGNFQPMNINFGIMTPLEQRIRNKEEKNTMIAHRALEVIKGLHLEDE